MVCEGQKRKKAYVYWFRSNDLSKFTYHTEERYRISAPTVCVKLALILLCFAFKVKVINSAYKWLVREESLVELPESKIYSPVGQLGLHWLTPGPIHCLRCSRGWSSTCTRKWAMANKNGFNSKTKISNAEATQGKRQRGKQ